MMISKSLENRLTMQGFACTVDSGIPALQPWLRLTPAISTLWIAAGIFFTSPVTLFVFALVSAFGSIRKSHPFDALYNHGIRKLLNTPFLPANPIPRRFAMALAAAWSVLVAILFMFGAVVPGYLLGALLLLAGGVNVFTHFCLGSWIYHHVMKTGLSRETD